MHICLKNICSMPYNTTVVVRSKLFDDSVYRFFTDFCLGGCITRSTSLSF